MIQTRKTATAPQERRALKVENLQIREMEVDGQQIGIIEGYLAVYGNRDFYGTALQKKCFAKSLSEHDSFPLLADHNPECVIGKFSAQEDDHGLKIRGEIILGIMMGKEKYLALKAGAINGLSVGFSIIKDEWDEEAKLLKIIEARLWEGSVVTFPANELAGVDAVRSLGAKEQIEVLPLLRAASDISAAAALAGPALTGRSENIKRDKTRALALIEEAQSSIEALRQRLEAVNEAVSPSPEPRSAHLDDSQVAALAEEMKKLMAAFA